MSLADRIEALLPQTQCTRCGFPDCRSYAEAVAGGASAINRCPPGGEETIVMLSGLTGQMARPLDPECGVVSPYAVAVIDEAWCIGCTICIQYCPVDAIVGAPKRMHTVIAQECTGCELCVAPCPVDCIEMTAPVSGALGAESWLSTRAPLARIRYQNRRRRLARLLDQRRRRRRGRRIPSVARRKADIASARARVHQRRPPPAPDSE